MVLLKSYVEVYTRIEDMYSKVGNVQDFYNLHHYPSDTEIENCFKEIQNDATEFLAIIWIDWKNNVPSKNSVGTPIYFCCGQTKKLRKMKAKEVKKLNEWIVNNISLVKRDIVAVLKYQQSEDDT